jgi:hypothetical protein
MWGYFSSIAPKLPPHLLPAPEIPKEPLLGHFAPEIRSFPGKYEE